MLSNAQKQVLLRLGNDAFTYDQLRELFSDNSRFKKSLNILIRDGYVIQNSIGGRTLYFSSQYGRNLARLLDRVAVLEGRLASIQMAKKHDN